MSDTDESYGGSVSEGRGSPDPGNVGEGAESKDIISDADISDFALDEIFRDEERTRFDSGGSGIADSDGGYSSPSQRDTPTKDEVGGGNSFLSWESALEILGKDHPLLRPYQEAKRKQLLQERDLLLLEIRQTELQKIDTEQENTKLGGQLYHLQEEVTRAQVKLDQVKSERESVKCSGRTTLENLEKARKGADELEREVSCTREKKRMLLIDLSKVDQKMSFIKILKSKCDGDLTSLRNSLQSVLWDKTYLEKDKEIQKFHHERLQASLRREQNTLDILRDATDRILEESHALKEAAWDQQQELQAVERESKAVEKAWEQNILLMEKRSQKFADSVCLLNRLRAEEAGLKKAVLNTRREVKESQLEHERVSHRFLSLENFLITKREKFVLAQEELVKEVETKTKLEQITDKLEEEGRIAAKECDKEKALLDALFKRLQSATLRARQLEDASLEKLNQQTVATKSSENLKAKIRILKEECRCLEDEMIAEEQQTAREALKVSNLKNSVQLARSSKDDASEHVDALQMEAEKHESQFNRLKERIKSNHNIIHRLKTELQKLIDINQGHESSPAEREERALQLELKERMKERLQLQQEALHLQRDVLLAKKANQNLKDKGQKLIRDHQVLNDRFSRLTFETKLQVDSFERAKKSQARFQTAIGDVDAQLHREKTKKEEENHLTSVSELEFSAALKELESDCRKEEERLDALRFSLETHEDDLGKATSDREIWERKLQTAREAKEEYLKEKGAQGDMEAMKREINRMNVRWRALESTQRDLSTRLSRSVATEDALKFRASAALEKVQRDPNSARATREMQLDSIKRKISKCQKILAEIQQKTDSLQQQKRTLQESLQLKERQYESSVKMLQEAAKMLQDKMTKKQEDQIHLQEERTRLRYYTSVKENRYRSLAANNEEAHFSVKSSLEKRVESYRNVLAQLLAGYPYLQKPLSAATRLLDFKNHNYT